MIQCNTTVIYLWFATSCPTLGHWKQLFHNSVLYAQHVWPYMPPAEHKWPIIYFIGWQPNQGFCENLVSLSCIIFSLVGQRSHPPKFSNILVLLPMLKQCSWEEIGLLRRKRAPWLMVKEVIFGLPFAKVIMSISPLTFEFNLNF